MRKATDYLRFGLMLYGIYCMFLPLLNYTEHLMEVHRMVSFDTRYISWFEWGVYLALCVLSVSAMLVVVVNPQQRIYQLGGEND